MNGIKLDFRIKLLSGNNVVLVEAQGFESEIFVPQILRGRISFQNIIPNRRCCYCAANPKQVKGARIVPGSLSNKEEQPHAQTYERKVLQPVNGRVWRMVAGQETTTTRGAPLANSTPSSSKHTTFAKENRVEEGHSKSYPTPETARLSVPSPLEVVKDTLVQIPSGIKVIRLYRNPTPKKPKCVGRIVGTNTEISGYIPKSRSPKKNESVSPSFRLPSSPKNVSCRCPRRSTLTCPTQSSLQKQVCPPGTVAKWRKCLTPIRTYGRHSVNLQRRISSSSMKKIGRMKRVQPSFMPHATKGTKGTHKLEVRKRKLIIDPKVTISPRSFKKQQQRHHHHQYEDPETAIDVIKCNGTQPQLLRTRQQYEDCKQSAFDMLTNSNRVSSISAKLNRQFRNGCINKASSTNSKYKVLCTIPPLSAEERSQEMRCRPQDQRLADILRAQERNRSKSLSEAAAAYFLNSPKKAASNKSCVTNSSTSA